MKAHVIKNEGDDQYTLVIEGLNLGDVNRIAIQTGEYDKATEFATTSGDVSKAITEALVVRSPR